jgi:hypothetical protein
MAGIAALTIIAAALAIHKDRPSQEKDRRVDWIGAALSTVALVLLAFSLAQSSSAKDGWRTPCEALLAEMKAGLLTALVQTSRFSLLFRSCCWDAF